MGAALVALCCTAGPVCAGDAEQLAAARAVVDEPVLVAPTQGRPVFVAPGGAFHAVLQFPQPPGNLSFALVAAAVPPHRHDLDARPAGNREAAAGRRFELKVPPETPERTYDLVVRGAGVKLVGRHAVAVRRLGRRIRLVHLSDMNVGELGVPGFDERLIAEVNLLGPTLIVATGDMLDATCADPDEGWRRASDFLARFDAPALVACGDHDDVSLYSRHMAPSPVGMIDVGAYRGLVLFDMPSRPIVNDAEQIRWVERELGSGKHVLSFIVAHDECPSLLQHWQDQGMLGQMVRGGRLGLWIAGGRRDWDGQEYRAIVDAAGPLLYLRTHQSSGATHGGTDGVSHYRVLDLDGERAILYGPPSRTGIAGSLAVGRVEASFDGVNDGTRRQVATTVVNRWPFRLNDLSLQVLVRREGDGRPWCRGARIERLVELPEMWECWLTFDLPDKGARRLVVGTGSAPDEPEVDVQFLVSPELVLQPAISEDAVEYLTAGDWLGLVQLTNVGSRSVAVTPLIRLDGESVAYKVVEEPGPVARAYRLRLAPKQVLTLQPDLSAVRVAPGRRELQVYLKGGAAWEPVCAVVEVKVAR